MHLLALLILGRGCLRSDHSVVGACPDHRPVRRCAAVRTGGWPVGIGGLFGYPARDFAALRRAPPADASLIA
jgi:hypothetical protein